MNASFTILRTYHNTHTSGVMFEGKGQIGFVLEDIYRGQDLSKVKEFGNTCIPEGAYELIVNYSNRFKKNMILLLKVPFFEGVRIHGGNTIADTLGCPLLGEKRRGINHEIVFSCKTVNQYLIDRVLELSKKQKVYLEIKKL
jgi:Family of unknown function (DUF5675)